MKSTVELWTAFAQRQQAVYPRLHRLMSRWEEFFPLDYGKEFNPSLGDYQRSRIHWEDFRVEYEHQLWSYTEMVSRVEEALMDEVNFIAYRTLLSMVLTESSSDPEFPLEEIYTEHAALDLDLPTLVEWVNRDKPVFKWALTEAIAPLEWHLAQLIAWWFSNPKGLEEWTEALHLSQFPPSGLYYERLVQLSPQWVYSGKKEDIPFPLWMEQMSKHVIRPRMDEDERVGHPLETLFPPLAV